MGRMRNGHRSKAVTCGEVVDAGDDEPVRSLQILRAGGSAPDRHLTSPQGNPSLCQRLSSEAATSNNFSALKTDGAWAICLSLRSASSISRHGNVTTGLRVTSDLLPSRTQCLL